MQLLNDKDKNDDQSSSDNHHTTIIANQQQQQQQQPHQSQQNQNNPLLSTIMEWEESTVEHQLQQQSNDNENSLINNNNNVNIAQQQNNCNNQNSSQQLKNNADILHHNNQTKEECTSSIIESNDNDSNSNQIELKTLPKNYINELEHLCNLTWRMQSIPYDKLEQILDIVIDLLQKQNVSDHDEPIDDSIHKHFVNETVIKFYKKFFVENSNIYYEDNKSPIITIHFKLIKLIILCLKYSGQTFENLQKQIQLLSLIFSQSNRFLFFEISEDICQRFGIEINSFRYTIIQEQQQQQQQQQNQLKNSLFFALIEYFGHNDGFDLLLAKIFNNNNNNSQKLSINMILIYLQPFYNCIAYLSSFTMEKYYRTIINMVPNYIGNLSDEKFKNELKPSQEMASPTTGTAKSNDLFGMLVKKCKLIAKKLSDIELMKSFEYLYLKNILRILQLSSFSEKMQALSELNKIISNYLNDNIRSDGQIPIHNNSFIINDNNNDSNEISMLNSAEISKWLHDNNIVDIILNNNCLHHSQYVEKLDIIFRFLLKENRLTIECLNYIWNAQMGNKHEIIVKNIHELIAKLAWHFQSKQLDYLFLCFQSSWSQVTRKEREKLLELMRRLAEDDKYGSLASKMLLLLWNIAYNEKEIDNDIIDQAIESHFKILDYSKTFEKDNQRCYWIKCLINEIKKSDYGNNVITAIKHLHKILLSYPDSSIGNNVTKQQQQQMIPQQPQRPCNKRETRQFIISEINKDFNVLNMLITSLSNYIHWIRHEKLSSKASLPDPKSIMNNRRFSHYDEIYKRLEFLLFIIQEGCCFLTNDMANEIWSCLAINSVYEIDKRMCFQWFSLLIDLDIYRNNDEYLKILLDFLHSNITNFDPTLIDVQGVECFEKIFKIINCRNDKILFYNNSVYLTNDIDLIGADYLWKVILFSSDELTALKAINLLKEFSTNLGPKLCHSRMVIHQDFINICFDQLKCSHDTITVILNDSNEPKIMIELTKMTRILTLLYEYIRKGDMDFGKKRTRLPMSQCFRDKTVELFIKIITTQTYNRNVDELILLTHRNELMTTIRAKILEKIDMINENNVDIEICEPIDKINLLSFEKVGDLTKERQFYLTVRVLQQTNTINWTTDFELANSFQKMFQMEIVDVNLELSLPGVIMSEDNRFINFLFNISDLAIKMNEEKLFLKCFEILQLMPTDRFYKNMIIDIFLCPEKIENICNNENAQKYFENELFSSSSSSSESTPTKTIYLLEILYSLLMPINDYYFKDSASFQRSFIQSNFGLRLLHLLNDETFLMAMNNYCLIRTLHLILKINKFTLFTYIFLKEYSQGLVEKSRTILRHHFDDNLMKNMASDTAQTIYKTSTVTKMDLFIPTDEYVDSLIRMAWITSTENSNEKIVKSFGKTFDELHDYFLENFSKNYIDQDLDIDCNNNNNNIDAKLIEMYDVCQNYLETITLTLLLLSSSSLKNYNNFKRLENFFIDLILITPIRNIRSIMSEQFSLISMINISNDLGNLKFILELIFKHLQTTVYAHHKKSGQYFQFCCHLLNCKCDMNELIDTKEYVDKFIDYEYDLLSFPKQNFYKNGHLQEILLEGHLSITKVLVSKFCSAELKCKLGLGIDHHMNDEMIPSSSSSSSSSSSTTTLIAIEQFGLVNRLLDQYLFTASKSLCLFRQNSDIFISDIFPVCFGSQSVVAAYELLASFCNGCVENLEFVCKNLESYMNTMTITSWDYFPNITIRPDNGFVGLKNAGATCYMNSVLQQLFMIPEVRNGILSVIIDSPYHFYDDNYNNDFDNSFISSTTNVINNDKCNNDDHGNNNNDNETKIYNIEILQQIQIIFGHLLLSQSQFYVPKGFWEHFRLFGNKLNLKEQQDALEFFNGIFDILDEALRALKQPPIMSSIFGGSFSDQKICKDCPHRYSREEPFTTLNVDVRNHHTLNDSLEQYVRGDLLEGDNAYNCEKCDRKVNAVKRLCIKRLPKILVIQLKRFGYDFDHDVSMKFNDYFEFPRLLDMEPYTANGLARKEGEIIETDHDDNNNSIITEYELNGIVVHSGQASGGHYYSYVLDQTSNDEQKKWYKFDDTDVSECKLDQDDEMCNQCFGGEYMTDYYDQILKKVSQRLQKRWWNAFILIYRRIDQKPLIQKPIIPKPITKNVQHQNTLFIHQRTLFSEEFYYFIKYLIDCNRKNLNYSNIPDDILESIIKQTLNLAAKFLFKYCFRSKKSLRINANEWIDLILPYLRHDSTVRRWFIRNHLVNGNNDVQELFLDFLIHCPSNDVRNAFSKMILFLIRFSIEDHHHHHQQQQQQNEQSMNSPFVNEIMIILLSFLQKNLFDFPRHTSQYFNIFHSYGLFGRRQRKHLLMLDVPSLFITYAIEKSYTTAKSMQNNHIDIRLYQLVSILVRSCDVSSFIVEQYRRNDCGIIISSNNVKQLMPNPFVYVDHNDKDEHGDYIMEIPENLIEKFYLKNYYLSLMIDNVTIDENVLLIKFACWEHRIFSYETLNEILTQLNNQYTTYELEPYFGLLRDILSMQDSLQHSRICFVLYGQVEDIDTDMEGINHNNNNNNQRIHNQSQPKSLLKMLSTNSATLIDRRIQKCLDILLSILKQQRVDPSSTVIINNDKQIKCEWLHIMKRFKQQQQQNKIDDYNNNNNNNNNNQDYDHDNDDYNWSSIVPPLSSSTSSSDTIRLLNEIESYLFKQENLHPKQSSSSSEEEEVKNIEMLDQHPNQQSNDIEQRPQPEQNQNFHDTNNNNNNGLSIDPSK